MIPQSEKNEDWKKECMDKLESIGRRQHYRNVKLMENYEMVKGRFIFSHYVDDENYADLVTSLTQEFDIPNYLRHYDITSQIINTMSGEWQKRPDLFRVKSYGERYDNDFLRAKTEMLSNYIQYNINNEINKKLLDMGIDPNKSDFQSQDEQQQYIQLVAEKKQALTPPEIQEYMTTKWMQTAEIWGQHQLEYDKEHFKLAEKEKLEFEDMLIADRCFRHFYISGTSYEQETWNPINTFFHKSPEVQYIEDGDYVGRVYYTSINGIIDKYGWLMTPDQMDEIRGNASFKKYQAKDANGIQYGSVVPFADYGSYKTFVDAAGNDPMTSLGISTIDSSFLNNLSHDSYAINTAGLLQVTEAYWKSQKKIGKIVYFDEDGILQKQLVDENFIVPKYFKVSESSIYDNDDPDSISWTWINEAWKGIKISAKNARTFTEDIYLDIKPLEFQFKGDLNPYNAKLPVCGQVFSVRNSSSMSLVDLVKPHQIGYNVAMNQLYQIMEREIGRFIIMDVNMFPILKDWGGEKGWDKFMLVAKNLGMAPIDTSANNTPSLAATGGQFPKDVNLDESARMMSRIKIAEYFETMALKQVGFNQYRLGNFSSESTAAGVEQGSKQSYAQTETYFTNFSNYLRRCYTMNLDIAQYVQSKKDDITISYIKSDMSRAFIKLAGTDLMGNQMGVFVSNSQEQLRQLETLRQMAMTNNTAGATMVDLADIVTMNSPQEIKIQLKQSLNKQQAREDRQIEIQQEQMKQNADLATQQEQLKDLRMDKELASKERIAYIGAAGRQSDNTNGSGEDLSKSLLDYDKFNAQQEKDSSNIQLSRDKQIMEKERLIADIQHNKDKLDVEKRKIEAGLALEDKKIQLTKILKGQDIKNKKKN
jgi:hypothetical protein